MKNTTLLFIALIVIIGAGAYFFGHSVSSTTGNTTGNTNGDVQRVVISAKNGNYYPQEVRVKAGQPVTLSLDSSVQGCFRSFTIRELGVAKYLATPQDSVTFTPTKAGTYGFSCSMGMAYGKLVVE